MTREDAKKLLGENATEEQITTLLNSVHTEISKKDDEIKNLNAKVVELSPYQEELNQIKQSQMTEQEKLAAQQKELAEKISQANKLTNSIKAKSILVGAGISNERADVLVSKFVRDDEQATLDLANDFVSELNAVKVNTEKQVKDNLGKLDPTPNGSNINPKGDVVMDWNKFTQLSQEEQNKFAIDHPNEFAQL